jgi:phosphate/phosphite/phosphonate ABC transporter binding protein
VTGFQEEDARNMWQAGNAAFMRNWPYAYSLGNADDSVIKGIFDVAPLPFGDSGHGAATLGGWQIAVSKYSEHPEVAADVALFMTSREEQKIRAVEGSFNPTVMDLYQDADVCAASPFMCKLYDVFINAVARPSTATAPQYNEVSTYFFQAAHSVLTGDNDAQTALEELELDLEDVTGFEVGAPEEVVAPPEEECTTLGCPDYPIKVLFVPSVDVDFMMAGGDLIEQALNEATGLVFEVSVPTSYAATIEEMCASRADTIGFIPAMGYALANQLCGVDPGLASVRYGWNVYWTEFVVARDSEYQTLEDLDGATWAYPDAGSTSGYLYPMAIFDDLGVTLADTVEAGGHPQAVKAVYNGEADVGTAYFSAPLLPEGNWGIDDPPDVPDEFVEECARNDEGQLWCGGYRVLDARAAISEEAPDVVQKVRILALSGEIPNDTMSFSPDFPEELRQTIMDAVAAYVLSEECEQTLCNEQFYDWTDTAPIYDENFDGIRLLMEAQGITLENLGE